jgi:hypothetical protein
MKEIEVNGKTIKVNEIVNTVEGRARLDYIGRQTFTSWTLIDQTDLFIFGRPINVEDNDLHKFIL